MLENVATNACKYAPEGVVQILVEAPPSGLVGTVDPPHRLRFSVIDRGPGIAMADHALIFEPFSRVSTQTRMHGVGLGLPICRQILQAMGSGLRLDSDRDRGACFWFELEVPALDEATEGAEAMVGSERESRPPDSLLAPAREMLELGQLLAIER